MSDIVISIAKDFTDTPGGRTIAEGNFSGELFRQKVLYPKFLEAKKENVKLIVDLDGCMGYPSSFLDESFGGLVKLVGYDEVMERLILISEDQPRLVENIKKYIKNNKDESSCK